ncbi:MAG: hypothetical protein KDA77_22130, partial [Planctomycetaceae bacterium]|nr:hypothetical protein [Planctomycetaceae bacterium]
VLSCGKFLLAGPAFHTWDLSNAPQTSLKIAATASGFLHLKTDSSQKGNATIKVNGFPNMQLTLLKIPQSSNRPSLTATHSLPSTKVMPQEEFIDVRLSCRHPAGSTVETVSLEWSGAYLSRADRQPRQFQSASLKTSLLSQPEKMDVAIAGTHPEGEHQLTDFLIRLPRTVLPRQSEAECLSIKAVVLTATQNRMAALTEFKLPPPPAQRLAEAAKAAKN